jgi:hypothetical protein
MHRYGKTEIQVLAWFPAQTALPGHSLAENIAAGFRDYCHSKSP